MGMNTYVEAFKPPDKKWKRMKSVWEACEDAGVDVPAEVEEYFAGEPPTQSGVKLGYWSLNGQKLPPWAKSIVDSGKEGFEIDTKQLPPDVSVIRFVNSY